MFPIIIIIGAIIGISVLVSVVKTLKNAKQEEEKANAAKTVKTLEGKDDIQKFLGYDSSSEGRPQNRDNLLGSANADEERRKKALEFEQRMNSMAQKNPRLKQSPSNQYRANTSPKSVAQSTVSGSHHDSHCDVRHSDKDKYKVEYVPTMNSIGGKSSEGCGDHYNVRYVKVDDIVEKHVELTPLQKVVVYGEVLNEPAYKRSGVLGRRR